MRFALTHEFATSPHMLWNLFASAQFEMRMEQETGLYRKLLERRLEDGVEMTRHRCSTRIDLPAVAATHLGTDIVSFEQSNRFDREHGYMEWEVIPYAFADRIQVHGTVQFATGPGYTRRRIDGEVHIQVPLVGALIERKVTESMCHAFESSARIAKELLGLSDYLPLQ